MKSLGERCAELMVFALHLRGWKRSELANRLAVSKPYITKLLSGSENLTVQQVERVLGALGFQLDLRVERKRP